MKSEVYTMEDALSEIIDYRGKTPKKSESGIPTLSAKSVKNGFIDYSNCYYISQDEYKRFMVRGSPKRGDILLTTEAPLGMAARLDRDDVGIAQRLLTLRGKSGVLENDYLFYWLQSRVGQHALRSKESGTTVTGIKQSEFRKIRISLPDIQVQRKIAGVLKALDDKIALNTAINKNLEEQARAIFKAWFIDFEPWGGVMPAEWKTGCLKDILELRRDSIKAGEKPCLPYLPIDAIPMNTLAVTEFKANEDAKSSLVTFAKDDILIGAMRVYFHRVVIAPCDGITRTTCFVLRPYQSEYRAYGLLCCNQDESIHYAQKTSKGSTMPYAVWDGGLGDMEISIPSVDIAREFEGIVSPIIQKIQISYFENKQLRELRDALLPKLMSGEISV